MKGILFTELLFNKTIAKQKTQTRREGDLKKINHDPDRYKVVSQWGEGMKHPVFWAHSSLIDRILVKPRYNIGEVCYIKEPWSEDDSGVIRYRHDFPPNLNYPNMKFKNKLFMGEKYARYYIKITDVKVERLFDISEEDVISEGVEYDGITPLVFKDYSSDGWTKSHLESYLSLFRFANKIPKSREIQNIWVFSYDYKLCDKKGNEI